MRIHKFGTYLDGGKFVQFDKEGITYEPYCRLTYEGDVQVLWRDCRIITYSQESLRYTIGNMTDGKEKQLFQYALDVMDDKKKDYEIYTE